MHKQTVLIVAISARPYIQAAFQAGYRVIAIDAFNDLDAEQYTLQMHCVSVNELGFDALALEATLNSLDWNAIDGICYGAGLESQLGLISLLASKKTLWGNQPNTVADCKDPKRFFSACQNLGLSYPPYWMIQDEIAPEALPNVLIKTIGASGGGHITFLREFKSHQQQNKTVYYQAQLQGKSVSCLFLALAQQVQVIGMHEQRVESDNEHPFKFAGLKTTSLNKQTYDAIRQSVLQLSKVFELKGLNSLDVIVNDEGVNVLELNPRLSASLNVYEHAQADLFDAHIKACSGEMTHLDVQVQPAANQVIYAPKRITVSVDDWPDWARDIPSRGQVIDAGMPVCSVVVTADTLGVLEAKLQNNVAQLKQLLQI